MLPLLKNCVEVSVGAPRGQPFDEQDWEQLVQGVAGTKKQQLNRFVLCWECETEQLTAVQHCSAGTEGEASGNRKQVDVISARQRPGKVVS